MNKTMRLFLVLLFVGLGGVFLYPTIMWYFFTPEDIKVIANGSREQIRLWAEEQAGRDLERITALTGSETEMAEPIPSDLMFLVDKAKDNYRLEELDTPAEWTLLPLLKGFKSGKEVYLALEEHYRGKILSLKDLKSRILALGLDLSGGMSVVLEADTDNLEERLERVPTDEDLQDAVARAMEILNNRIDKFGVTEPQIRKQANNAILIEIPGEVDPDRVNSFLSGRGSLGFYLVDDEATDKINDYTSSGGRIVDGQPVKEGVLSAGLVVRGFYKKDSYGIDQFQRWIVVQEEAGLDGQHILSAQVIRDQITGRPQVIFNLDNEGGDIFFKFTSDNTDKALAVVMDDKVKAAARINEPIRANVSMRGFEAEEANDLALVLRTAAMPVELRVNTLQAVGASLGNDTIQAGLRAILYGFIAVFIFMIIYYKGAGLVADIALLLNLLLITAVLSSFNLTLTMTSIAGLILTVGMAVDANVIIFERIREELKLGKSRSIAIETGFKKAFWTVMDANITTFIAAIFLSQLGKGPVQGFAITLAVGIVCSLFTALFVSRLIFDFGTEVVKREKISIGWGL